MGGRISSQHTCGSTQGDTAPPQSLHHHHPHHINTHVCKTEDTSQRAHTHTHLHAYMADLASVCTQPFLTLGQKLLLVCSTHWKPQLIHQFLFCGHLPLPLPLPALTTTTTTTTTTSPSSPSGVGFVLFACSLLHGHTHTCMYECPVASSVFLYGIHIVTARSVCVGSGNKRHSSCPW